MPKRKTINAKPTSKSASTKPAASARVNKAAWIRSQPETMSARDVVEKAQGEGIKLSLAQVYTTRSVAKRAGASAPSTGRGRGRAASQGSAAGSAGDEAAFRRLALSIGLTRAEAYLSGLKSSVGL